MLAPKLVFFAHEDEVETLLLASSMSNRASKPRKRWEKPRCGSGRIAIGPMYPVASIRPGNLIGAPAAVIYQSATARQGKADSGSTLALA